MTAGVINEMDHKGDTKHFWDSDRPDEVKAARKTFDDLIAKGYLAYRLEGDTRGTQMRKFDPQAESIVMSPPMRGG